MNYILEVNNLSKEFNNFTLDNISFRLEPGYIMGFIGPNGAGKSTTIKLIMNLINKSGGEIKVFGLDHIEHEKEIKDRIGFVYDESHYYENLTIKQMKSIVSGFYSKWDDNIFNRYMREFNLNPKSKIKTLSKGMKTKFSLAVALSHNADLIIMDEPTSGLDPIFRREILDILHNIIQDEHKSIFFSTHITTDLEKVADYITFINNGKMVFSRPKDEILDNYAMVKGGTDLLNSDTRNQFIGLRETSVGFEGLTDNIDNIKKIFKDEVLIERATLEDIMFYIVRR
ncbi:MAG: ABC transporter ATP-binding protein [Clostridiaceae bacterium]|uniref:ABC transporter ATP-binding protein n=1 Tax=Anaerosalibacter bizertensis TaxID=932217 RepID=A0A9Q4FL48_9FIRM|nr:ABC transporter ATP-binding protein [Anaerosalibacter bizertensis]MBV1817230.1 ABC transporter ATP-binding protein [Bacteroidales bacterium MSK.15.36]MBW4828154.1 ABC transporter ATP-binding protein [Clostridiaceae bacterium]MBW4860931.1 ABC transporter ATP-binding protein [Clostridiaceae bacterium]MBW4867556.1 ABC transporter ATP-binding protein [Clostridiaceae bacterium]MCB5559436.1 ABC transporter ATP-binding protein [Anaerosalibacter bizertensis]